MNQDTTKKGFIAAGLMNIGAVLIFARAFTNEVINQADPIVRCHLNQVAEIRVWGSI